VLLYQLYKLLRGSVALNVALGLVSFYLLYLVVKATGMELLTKILGQFMSVGRAGQHHLVSAGDSAFSAERG
jgi:hypothetical protein